MRDKVSRERPGATVGVERLEGPDKRPYCKPVLTAFGQLAELTHGPSLGNSESGNPLIFML